MLFVPDAGRHKRWFDTFEVLILTKHIEHVNCKLLRLSIICKTAHRRAIQTEIWDRCKMIELIWDTFELKLFKIILRHLVHLQYFKIQNSQNSATHSTVIKCLQLFCRPLVVIKMKGHQQFLPF